MINNCQDTIKFTFKYSDLEATFLNVNIKIKEMLSLIRVFMKKSQTVISTLNFHHAILFHANRAFPLARVNVTDVLRRITRVLKKILTD